tara:strand:+ start:1820 stop:2260 length:441 start_codon:yes stop_codon:yes gene_type:complete
LPSNFSEKWLLKIAKDLENSREINLKGLPLLVEGRRDKELLLELGFKGSIEILNRGVTLESLATQMLEKYNSSKRDKEPLISILMDWDRTGDRLQKKLTQIFNSMDVTIDVTLRKNLIKSLNGRTKTVEGFRFLLEELLELMDTNP